MDENKNTIIIAICALCLFMTLMIACSRGCSSKPEKRVVKPIPEKVITPQQKEEPEYEEQYSPSRSSYSYSSNSNGKPPDLLSEEEKIELAKSYEENKKKLSKLKKEWMEKKINDPKLSKVAKEQLKLRSNPDFIIAMKAQDKKDYDTAIKSLSKITQDKKTSPVSKYFACTSLMEIAMKTKDFDLYFIAARMRANLIANEDLSILDIERNNSSLEWVENVENCLKAKKDPKHIDICVQLRLVRMKGKINEKTEKYVRKQVEKDIEYYSNKYKELIE